MRGISDKTPLDKLEELIVHDKRFIWTAFSYFMVFLIFLNMNIVRLPAVGVAVSFFFFLINSVFLGNALFDEKKPFLRFSFGGLALIAIICIIGWIVLIIYNLDATRSTLVLCIVSTVSSIMNKVSRYTFSIEFVREASKT